MPEKEKGRPDLPATYEFTGIEEEIYKDWLKKNLFHATIDWGRKRFSMVIPLQMSRGASTWATL